MAYKVSAADLQHIRLSEADTTASILQNVAVILATKQGTSPLYREFGLPQNFVDKPMPVAKPLIFAEVKEAVEKFEPRAEVVGISFAEDKSSPGTLIPTVEVEIREEY